MSEAIEKVFEAISEFRAENAKLREEVALLRSEIASASSADPPPSRTSYSVAEFAKMVARSDYSVRQWCNEGRVNAAKLVQRRGASAIWSIPASEVERYRNEGLLPLDPRRNDRN